MPPQQPPLACSTNRRERAAAAEAAQKQMEKNVHEAKASARRVLQEDSPTGPPALPRHALPTHRMATPLADGMHLD